jgi:hypothetical protein
MDANKISPAAKEYLRNAYREISTKLSKCIVPIFEIKGDQKNVFGSGLLVHAFSNNFLITAAHVVERLGNHNINIFINGQMHRLREGVLILRSTKSKENNIDLGIFLLSTQTLSLFAQSRSFMEFDGIGNIIPNSPDFGYLILGYPSSRNKFRYSVKLKVFAGLFFEAPDETYIDLKIRKENDFILEIDNENVISVFDNDELPRTLLKLTGISGGGVWLIGDFRKGGKGFQQPFPIGIVREINYQKKALMVTRAQYTIPALSNFVKIARDNRDSS